VSCRVTVVGSKRRLDATLPDSVPVAELLSDVVDMLGENENGASVEWGLVRVGGGSLDPELTLAGQGVAEGTMLFLRDLTSGPPAPAMDDFAGRVAIAIDTQGGRWTASQTPALLSSVAAGTLAAAGLALLLTGDAGTRATLGTLAVAVTALGAIALIRVQRRPALAAVMVFSGLPAWVAAGAGLAGLAAATPIGIVAAGLGGAAFGALVAIAIVGEEAFPAAEGVLAAAGIPAVVIGGVAAFGGGLLQAAALLVVIELLALALLAPLNVRLVRIGGADSASLLRRLRGGRRLQAASVIATALVITVSCAVLALSGGWFAKALVAATAVAAILRARHYRFVAEVAPLLATGLVSLILLELSLGAWFAPLLIADAVVLVGAATTVRRWSLSPHVKRWLGPVEALAIAATVPLALGVLGLYGAVAHFARSLA
jgi:type VII secretion integral membrane protein EccD